MKKEVIEKISTLLISAFGFVAALAWNSAVQAGFERAFGRADGVPAMVGYAVVVSLLAVAVTIGLGRWAAKAKDEG